MTTATGLDGARPRGWIAVRIQDDRLESFAFHPTLDAALDDNGDADALCVNLPLGHDDPMGGARACDAAARAYLGPHADLAPHAPPQALLELPDLEAARSRAKQNDWPEPTAKLWQWRDNVLAANGAAATDHRLREAHAEVSLQAILQKQGGTHYRYASRRWRAVHERLLALHGEGLRPARSFGGSGRASPKDVLDATACAWTAARVARGEARTLPAEPPRDPDTGRAVAIWH